jgi:hypothetical protein
MAQMTEQQYANTYNLDPAGYASWDAKSQQDYLNYTNTQATQNGPGSASAPVFNLPMAENKLAPGVPAYSGYQEPNYGSTTPNNTHWLNTMNAFAPQGRADMERLLGVQGQSAQPSTNGQKIDAFGNRLDNLGKPVYDALSSQYGITPTTQPKQNFTPTQSPVAYPFQHNAGGNTALMADFYPATQAQQPQQQQQQQASQHGGGSAYMSDFYTAPGSAYGLLNQQQGQTGLLGNYGPTVGIGSNGALMFTGNTK